MYFIVFIYREQMNLNKRTHLSAFDAYYIEFNMYKLNKINLNFCEHKMYRIVI